MAEENEEMVEVTETSTEESEQASDEVNFLDLSDEDFAKMQLSDLMPGDDEEEKNEIQDDESTETDDEESQDDDDESEDDDAEESTEEEDTEADQEEDDAEQKLQDLMPNDEDKDDDDGEELQTEKREDASEEEELSAEDQLASIYEPFKANGREMQASTPDDVRQLMQMGANYNKKMAALKPNLKLMKMLQNNDLLDEAKLSFLIDLDKKNPDAIKKLVADSKIDTDELDNDGEVSYKPNTYTVNDQEVELDDTLNDIRDTESYAKTLDIIGNKWDESSRQMLLSNPAAIRVLNDHVGQGYYDQIMNAVESERMFGRLAGMSDLEAYRQVADLINAKGGFQKETQPKRTSTKKTVVGKTAKKTVDSKLNDKRKAASSTKGSKTTKGSETFNPLAMSDEEFEKLEMSKFI